MVLMSVPVVPEVMLPEVIRVAMTREGWSSFDLWMSRLSPVTGRTYGYIFLRFWNWIQESDSKFVGLMPDELVMFQRRANATFSDEWELVEPSYEFLVVVQSYLREEGGQRYGSKYKMLSTVRSFFLHNRAPLPKDARYVIRAKVPKVRGSLTAEEIKSVVLKSNRCYRALFLCMLQGGMGLEEIIYWSNNGLEKLEKDLQRRDFDVVVRVDLPGRKMKKWIDPFYTFVGTDAIDALRQYLPTRPVGCDTIFCTIYGTPINKHAIYLYWTRKLDNLGFIERKPGIGRGVRYGKNPHEIRDVFRTLFEKSGSTKPIVAEFMMGHEIDPLEYNKACRDEAWVKKYYLMALPFLNILSSERAFGLIPLTEYEEVVQDRVALSEALERYRELPDVVKELSDRLKKMEQNKAST